MPKVSSEERFAVYDDWLEEQPLARLRSYLSGYRYFSVDPEGKRAGAGTLAELGPALAAGRVKLLSGRFVVKTRGGAPPADAVPYPSGTPFDEVLESVEARLAELEPWLGRPGGDWRRIGCGPKLYPAGRGMARHDDARFVGTFVLYAHEEWPREWAGGLSFEGGPVLEPRPNRCVFVKSGAPHQVLAVAPAAGAALRMSVIGYTYPRGR